MTRRKVIRLPITAQIVVDDEGQGWLVTLTWKNGDLRDLIAQAIENHKHTSAILGFTSPGAGVSSGHPRMALEALPLTEDQYEDLKGTVRVW